MITNVSYPDFRGKVNGIGQVFASMGRFFVCPLEGYQDQGPTIATNVYAWSLANGLSFPFDYNCIFILFAILQIVQTYLIYFLDDSANSSTPSIRVYVKQQMKLRGSEMVELKKEEEVVVVGDKEVKGNEVSEISPVVATTLETTSMETKGEESSNVNPDSVYIVYYHIISLCRDVDS